MPATENQSSLESYKALEERISKSDLDALLARWEFGSQLLEERRAHGKQLPRGRLEEICEALHLGGAEIHNRMQFAEEKPTKEEVANALAKYGSWYEIVRQGLGRRALKPEVHQPKWSSEVDRFLFDLANCAAAPRALRELVQDMTPEQRATAHQESSGLRDELDALEREMAAVEDQPNARAA
jgi:hypothetical protein